MLGGGRPAYCQQTRGVPTPPRSRSPRDTRVRGGPGPLIAPRAPRRGKRCPRREDGPGCERERPRPRPHALRVVAHAGARGVREADPTRSGLRRAPSGCGGAGGPIVPSLPGPIWQLRGGGPSLSLGQTKRRASQEDVHLQPIAHTSVGESVRPSRRAQRSHRRMDPVRLVAVRRQSCGLPPQPRPYRGLP